MADKKIIAVIGATGARAPQLSRQVRTSVFVLGNVALVFADTAGSVTLAE